MHYSRHRRGLTVAGLALLAPLLCGMGVAASAAPAVADTAGTDPLFVDDGGVVFDGDTPILLEPSTTRAGRAANLGYSLSGDTVSHSRNLEAYTIQLVASPGIETMRQHLVAAAKQVTDSGASRITVAPGTVQESAPLTDGQIRVTVQTPSGACGAGAAGCGGPVWTAVEGFGIVSSAGRMFLNPDAVGYTAAQRQHLVTHELGHVLGLGHHDEPFQGTIQVMHTWMYNATMYQAGDLAGLHEKNRLNVHPVAPVSAPLAQAKALHQDLLLRPATASDAAAIAERIAREGMGNVVESYLRSEEYRNRAFVELYESALGRVPYGRELTQLEQTKDGALTLHQLEHTLWASDERYALSGGTDRGWIADLYRSRMGREIAPGERDALATVLPSIGREALVASVLSSREHAQLATSAQTRLYLDRPADVATSLLGTPSDLTGAIRYILSTPEYTALAQSRYPQ